jgi:ABC-2 type transport system ATP-binding protein
MSPTVRVQDLKKSYGRVEAVRGVSFRVQPGEIFGLLGPNGAGKTTTLECILGLRDPDAGEIEVCGIDLRRNAAAAKERIGAALQSTALQDKITPREALVLFASFYKKKADLNALIKRFDLSEKADSFYDTLSGGQKQRLALALALVNEPDFLLLDEPTAALDPQSRRELHDAIRDLKASGKTVVLTTHYIEEAEQLCDRIAIIDHGKIIAEGTPSALIAASKALPRVTVQTSKPLDEARAAKLHGVVAVERENGRLTLATSRVGETVIDLVKWIEADGNELSDMQVRKPTLEDVFIELTGRKLRD